jgi:hypothetical protein
MSQTPPEMVGRVSAFADLVPTVFQMAGPIAGAAIIAVSGVGWVFAIAGPALAGVGLTAGTLPLSGRRPAADPEPSAAAASRSAQASRLGRPRG